MKIASGQVASTVRRSTAFAGLLIHGGDVGRVRELAALAVQGVLGGATDPFRLTVLAKEDHSRLAEAAGSRALGGGRSVVHVREATDGLATVLDRLTLRVDDVLVIVESPALTARSKLRGFAERQSDWGSIAVYAGSDTAVAGEIEARLRQDGLAITPDALAYLTAELGADTGTRRSELEKLALYATGSTHVDLAAAQACCAISGEATLSELAASALAGEHGEVDALLETLSHEGLSGAGLLAVLSGQVMRLLRLRVMIDAGQSMEQAARSVMPPIYPRELPILQRTIARWPLAHLEALGRAIHDADVACKRAASPDAALAGRLLTMVANRSARGRPA